MSEVKNSEIIVSPKKTSISETQVMALAAALEAVETYVPTTWVDNTEPDIDAEHLNHAEQGIKRVTDALNGAVATINNLSAQLANYIPVSKIVDNLLSTDPTTVLSGKMGKELSDLITANSNAISTLNSATVKSVSFFMNSLSEKRIKMHDAAGAWFLLVVTTTWEMQGNTAFFVNGYASNRISVTPLKEGIAVTIEPGTDFNGFTIKYTGSYTGISVELILLLKDDNIQFPPVL